LRKINSLRRFDSDLWPISNYSSTSFATLFCELNQLIQQQLTKQKEPQTGRCKQKWE